MNLVIELVFECGSEEEAEALDAVLAPDNRSIPKDQEFASRRDGPNLSFRISSERASGCVSSALGLLSDARLFQEVWTATS